MNDSPDNTGFDDALRGHHASAVERLSPRTRAQLAQRRNAALRGGRVAATHGFRYATAGLAAICALAIGLQFGITTGPIGPADTGIAAATGNAATTTMLDEDPEFYAWLASTDAQLMAME